MKILILGCGSIGSRHAQNLKSLGIKKLILCDTNKSRLKTVGRIIGTRLLYEDYKKAVNENSDIAAAIICTPSAYHIEPAIYFAKKKINLFIEKPLSNNLHKTKLLSDIVISNKLVVMMGHAFIFDPGFVKLKLLLQKKIIGKIYYVTYLQGKYLPDWHHRVDYRIEYTARKQLGGGALLTLGSHTFYLIEWLFGRIKKIHGSVVDRISSLEIDVDDSVFLLLNTDKKILVQTQNNFVSPIHQHKMIIEGEQGRIEYDVINKNIIVSSKHRIRRIKIVSDPNIRYLEEIKYFLKKLKNNFVDENLDLNSGIRFLKTIKPLIRN